MPVSKKRINGWNSYAMKYVVGFFFYVYSVSSAGKFSIICLSEKGRMEVVYDISIL